MRSTESPVEVTGRSAELRDAEYDYYMNDVDTTVFSANGTLSHRILADSLIHYPENDVANLETPHFFIFEDNQETPWEITANSAIISTDLVLNEERVDLMNDVIIHRPDSAGKPLNIYTDSLTVYPESRSLRTEAAVRMISPGIVVSAVGMRGNLDTRRMSLLSEVRGTYE